MRMTLAPLIPKVQRRRTVRVASETAARKRPQAMPTVQDQGRNGRRLSHLVGHCQASNCAAADIEGHSEAAKFSQPGRSSASVNNVRPK
jgi:hypothetical protein